MKFLVLIAVLPVVFLLRYVYNKDKNREPKELLKKIFWYGVLTVIPVSIFEFILDDIFTTDTYSNYIGLFISVFCGVALIEELFKWIVVKYVCYNDKEFDEIYDAIVYSTYSSLGFAFLENLLFVLLYGSITGIFRALCAVPGHACYGIIMGYYLGLAKSNEIKNSRKDEKKYLFLSIFIPTLLHTLYDFILFSHVVLLYFIWIIYLIVLFYNCYRIVKKVSDNNVILVNRHRYCSNCGKECDTNYCIYCGHKNIDK